MNVPGHDLHDLPVAIDDFPEAVGSGEADLVEHPHPREERRVMEKQQSGALRLLAKDAVEPRQLARVEVAVVSVGLGRVETDEADGVVVDDIVDGAVRGHPDLIGERSTERFAIVMVPGIK